ncbi:hypothetical protein ST27_08325 [Xanthomonas phaseoli pv. phaseoli]|uniref:hypothetical protein n=1 Tax=Xanthomonas phaseoli TaxID=1985254 RepID=UPI000595AF8E|nr:hypothetical protein [Xanthomonas phaseoli]KIJ00952.1 hypothetical protein ST27_08325 [Xanthomonas phaseoli pv. phaseoli]
MKKLREEIGNSGKIDHAAAQHTERRDDQHNNQANDEDGSQLVPGLPTEICVQGGHIGPQPLGDRPGVGVR